MSVRVYWGCTTFHCERGFYGTEEDMPRDRKTCPACGGDLAEITKETRPPGGTHGFTPGRVYLLAEEPVLLLCRSSGPGPRNALFLRPDGTKTCRPFRGVRRLRLRETRP